ncbi:Hsp20/alpha crystallin family protein [Persephonella sp.]
MVSVEKPPVDIVEENDSFIIIMDLPGVLPEDVEIKGDERSITITGIKKPLIAGKYVIMERSTGRFKRKVVFKDHINIENAYAKMENGILFIKVPKAMDKLIINTKIKILIRR